MIFIKKDGGRMTKIEEFVHEYGCMSFTQGYNLGREDEMRYGDNPKFLKDIEKIEKKMKKDLDKLFQDWLYAFINHTK